MRNPRTQGARVAAGVAAALLVATAAAQHEQHEQHHEHGPPVTAPTAAELAAAFPDVGGMAMGDMMLEDPLNRSVRLDELETRRGGGDPLAWDLDAWVGGNLAKLRLGSKGERRGGDTQRAELEILWSNGFARWWDVVAGARTDFATAGDRSSAAVGVRGLAPYRFDIEATAYLGNGGRAALRVETAYEVLVTNKLVLKPSLDLDWHGHTDAARGIGAGLGDAELGLRLRYEVRREIAPYVGVVRERSFGRTADLARAAGRRADDTRWVAGIRLWF